MLDFPDTPQDGDTHIEQGQVWTWNANAGVWHVGDSTGNAQEIVESGSGDNDVNWQVWGDVLIQWGFSSPSSAVEQTITFPQPFKTSPRVAANNNSQANGQFVQTYNLQPESFTCATRDSNDNITNGGVTWIAVGEAPDNLKKPKEITIPEGGGGGGGAEITIGDAFPASPPAVGSLHYLTTNPVGLYVLYDDGDSQQWVQTNGGGTQALKPAEAFHDPSGIASWRIDYTTNTLECWGYAGEGAGNPVTITFPKGFNNLPAVTCEMFQPPSGNIYGTHIASLSSSQVGVEKMFSNGGGVGPAGEGFYWRAIGEWDGNS